MIYSNEIYISKQYLRQLYKKKSIKKNNISVIPNYLFQLLKRVILFFQFADQSNTKFQSNQEIGPISKQPPYIILRIHSTPELNSTIIQRQTKFHHPLLETSRGSSSTLDP